MLFLVSLYNDMQNHILLFNISSLTLSWPIKSCCLNNQPVSATCQCSRPYSSEDSFWKTSKKFKKKSNVEKLALSGGIYTCIDPPKTTTCQNIKALIIRFINKHMLKSLLCSIWPVKKKTALCKIWWQTLCDHNSSL